MCKICEDLEGQFRKNVDRSGTEQEKEGDIMERQVVWSAWQDQKAKCNAPQSKPKEK